MAIIIQNNGQGPVIVGAGTFDELADPTHDHSTYEEGGPVQGFEGMNELVLDFGYADGGEGDTAVTAVSATWVDASSVIVCSLYGIDGGTPDHDSDDPVVEGLQVYVTDIVPGVGFNLKAYAPQGTWGRY